MYSSAIQISNRKLLVLLIFTCLFYTPIASHAGGGGEGGDADSTGGMATAGTGPTGFSGMVDSAIGAIGDAASAVGDAASDAASAVGAAFGGGSQGSTRGGGGSDSGAANGSSGIGAYGGGADTPGTSGGNDGAGGGSFGASRRATPPPPPPVERAAELEAITAGAFTINDTTTFSGSIVNTGNSVAKALNPNVRKINNRLLVDYTCDGTVDKRQQFETDFELLRTGRNNTISFSASETEIPNGNHCFSFTIDLDEKYTDTNRQNNKTQFENFSVQNLITTATGVGDTLTTGDNDQAAVAQNPDAVVVDATPAVVNTSNGVTTDITDAPPLLFQIRTRKVSNESTGQLSTVTDWTSDDVSVRTDETISVKWNAPGYEICFPFIFQDGFSNKIAVGATSANTEVAGVAVRLVNGAYRIKCTTDDNLDAEQSIAVTVIQDSE